MQAQTTPTKLMRDSQCPQTKFSTSEALRFRLINGLSFGEIAKIYGVGKSTVWERLSRYINRLDIGKQATAYSESEARFLSYVESELALDLLNPEKREKASLNNIAYAYQQVNNARRLAEGKSTANIDCRSVIVKANDELEAIRAEIARRKSRVINELEDNSSETTLTAEVVEL